MAKKIKITLIVLSILIVGGAAAAMAKFASPPTSEELSRRFITSNPLDLSQIAGFSKYRSCAGHDFRAPAAATGKMESSPRSMKHYMKARSDLSGKNAVVKALAPFDGKIYGIYDDFGGPGDQQVWLTPDSISPRQWQFIFFHIDLEDSLKEGSAVKAGQLIGTANLNRGPDNATDNFDIAVKFTRPLRRPAIDAPFNHATQSVLDEYKRYGVSANDLIISEEERDAVACPIDPNINYGGPDAYFSREAGGGDYVWLRN